TFGEMAGAAIAQIVAVDAGDHDIAQSELGDGFRQVFRLVDIQRVGAAVTDVAERATARAFVTHDHEGGRTFTETFTDVRAAGFLAYRHQLIRAQDVFD